MMARLVAESEHHPPTRPRAHAFPEIGYTTSRDAISVGEALCVGSRDTDVEHGGALSKRFRSCAGPVGNLRGRPAEGHRLNSVSS